MYVVVCKSRNHFFVVISCSHDNIVQFWNIENQKNVASKRAHTDYVSCLAYSNQLNIFASGGFDGCIFLWNVDAISSQYHPYKIEKLEHSVYCLGMSASGNTLISGGTDRLLHVFDPKERKRVGVLRGHKDTVKSCIVNQDGTMV
jgi:WD repeat-containing protein 48